MRKINLTKMLVTAVAVAAMALASAGPALAFGHYTPGALGLGSATLPPEGFHWTMYNIYYSSDTMLDKNGHDTNAGLDLDVFASAQQFTYMTKYKFLGAPLVST